MDKDIGENGRISYSIGNDSRGLIRINEASGLITTAGIFDHEVLRQYRVEVVATDSGNMRSQSTKVMLDIMVDDINDSAPEFSQYRYVKTISLKLIFKSYLKGLLQHEDKNKEKPQRFYV